MEEMQTHVNKRSLSRSKRIARFFKKLTFGKIMKFIAVLIIITVYVLLFGRMYLASDRGIMNRFSLTDNVAEIYKEGETKLLTQTLNESMDENGYFRISNPVFIPEAGELQVNVRYNNSTVDVLNEEYPDRDDSGEPFVFTLTDNNGKVYSEYRYLSSSNIIYNFRKLAFDGIDYESIERLYINIYYAEDTSADAPLTVTFTVYNSAENTYETDLKVDPKNKDVFIEGLIN